MAIVSSPPDLPAPSTAGGEPPAPPSGPPAPPTKPDPLLDSSVVSPAISTPTLWVTAVLTFTCIVFALALCTFVIYCAMQQKASELMIRLLMSCIACFVGLAFASLGFGLFLLRARGGFRARFDGQGTTSPALLESTAPGLVVVVCATIVMWLALRVKFEITTTSNGPNLSRFNYTAPKESAPTPDPTLLPAQAPHLADGVSPP